MSKNREDVLIHTYSPEFHREIVELLIEAAEMAHQLNNHFSLRFSARYTPAPLERQAMRFGRFETRVRRALSELEAPPK